MNAQKLKEAGFVETTYAGQEGVFLTKRMSIGSMRYGSEHIVDNDTVLAEDMAVIEVVPANKQFPKGGVRMVVENTDYYEETVPLDTEEGIGLLRDAGVSC
ncbi:MAG: hypothetical protein M0T84_05215 [Betaproteobacteria bacterium]|nr:hypothetical protein [Betaproteobacteria bacterium]